MYKPKLTQKCGGDLLIAFSLLTAILPIVIVVFVIAYVVSNKEKGDETVIRHLYTYLVLFATLMMVIGGGISIFMATADLVNPPVHYETFSDYKRIAESGKLDGKEVNKSDEELRAEYEQMVEDSKLRSQENAKNQIIKSLGFIVIPLPVFLYFNRLRKQQAQ